MAIAITTCMPAQLQTIDLSHLASVIGGVAAYTAAATSSHDLPMQGQGTSVQQDAPGSGGYASRVSSQQ